jgi:competence protein ComEC
VAAEAALFPVAAYAFSRVTFAGLALNFVAIPLMTVAQVLGLAVVGIGAISAGGASLVGYLAHLAAAGLVESAALVDLAPWLTYRVPPPSLAVCAIYYAGAIAWLGWPADVRGREGWRAWARRAAQAIAIGSAFWILAAPWSLRRASPGALRVAFLDVGQGDAALVRFPDGRSLVVDCGGLGAGASFDVGERVVSPALRALGVRGLDYLALTHGDPDHIGGAPAVIRDFTPSEVWEGVPVPPGEPLRLLASAAARSRAAWRTLRAGDRVRIGGVDVRLWHPPPPDWERQQVRNDDSLVIELRFGNVSVLLAGDIGREVERELAPALEDAGLRVIKVPHHGSATSSSVEFLRAARPAIAVFSAGRGNRYGHPVPFVLERYRDLGAAIFRTDQDGAVLLETNGETVNVRTWTGRGLRVSAMSNEQ